MKRREEMVVLVAGEETCLVVFRVYLKERGEGKRNMMMEVEMVRCFGRRETKYDDLGLSFTS